MTVDAAILAVVVAVLLPLRLLSLALRLVTSSRGSSADGLRRSCAALALTATLLAAIFAIPRDHARECAAPAGVADGGHEYGGLHEELRAEVEQLKLQVAQLGSLDHSKVVNDKGDALEEKYGSVMRTLRLDVQSLFDAQENIKACLAGVTDGGHEEGGVHDDQRVEVEQLKLQLARLGSLWDSLKALDDKGDALEEKNGHVMRALELDIQSLFDMQENIKEILYSSYANSINTMENEVQILKDESRKMNSDIYNIQSFAKDTTERIDSLHSDIKKVQVITDEWGKLNSTINRMWLFARDTEKRVEDIYSDIIKGFKQRRGKMRFWKD